MRKIPNPNGDERPFRHDTPRVCVCVLFYYTPISSVARGVLYLLQSIYFSSTQLSYNQLSVGTPSEKVKGKENKYPSGWCFREKGKRVDGVPRKAGRDWPELRGLQLTNGSYKIPSGPVPRRCEVKVVRMGRVFVRRGRS